MGTKVLGGLGTTKGVKGSNSKRIDAPRTNSNGVKEVAGVKRKNMGGSLQNNNFHNAFSSERLSNSNNLLNSKD